ncbi:MAG TPA: hypothetical protein VGM05_01085 [Planctomycetaceae bacterium]|jgi:hypothetical protein
MTREQARDFIARWERVNEFQLAERKAMTPTERFRKVVLLMDWVKCFGWRAGLEREEQLARDVWNRIRRLHRGNT